jgi:hypothetical protein
MSFDKRTHDVVSGRITQYRKPVGEPRRVKRPGPRGTQRTGRSAERWAYPSEPRVGKVFVVRRAVRNSATGEIVTPAVHATITAVRREWLGAIDFAGAKAEGHRTTDDFKIAWTRDHDGREVKRGEAWALRELGEDGLRVALLARFVRHHAAREVWVVTFRLSEGRDRFLAAGSAGDERGYVTSPGMALDPDASVVDEFTQAAFAKKAEAHRASFKADLERGRAEQKAARGRSMRDAA